MRTLFLERDQPMAVLQSALSQAESGFGVNVVISGEPGVGKSTLVEQFARSREQRCKVLLGGCEMLSTPRPLGPLCDVAVALGERFARNFSDGSNTTRIFQELIAVLAQARQPILLVFEDIHWADFATMDLIKYLARRSMQLPLVFVLTYREQEVERDHPLRAVLGELPVANTKRIPLQGLSRQGVDEYCRRTQVQIPNLYGLTSGNPFLVTMFVEAAQHPGSNAMASLRDTVLARIDRLSPTARALCELVSVVPGSVELSVLESASSSESPEHFSMLADRCITSGILELDAKGLRFRHEIARLEVEQSLSSAKHQNLHQIIFRCVAQEATVSYARLVHHASFARLDTEVARLAPLAALEARKLGAHREAFLNYERSISFLSQLPTEIQAEVLEGWAIAKSTLDWPDRRVIENMLQATALWKSLGKTERAGGALRLLAFGFWLIGRRDEGVVFLDEAIQLLETIEPTASLAIAYSMKVKVYMAESNIDGAIELGRRAIKISQDLKADEALAHSLTYLGAAMLRGQHMEGKKFLLEGIALGRDKGFHESTGDAYHNLVESLFKQYQLSEAEQCCADALAFSGQFGSSTAYLNGLDSQILGARGQYLKAEAIAVVSLEALPAEATFAQWPALCGLGVARCRAGLPEGIESLRRALEVSIQLKFTQDILPSASALCEALAFEGDFEGARKVLRDAWAMRANEYNAWLLGGLAVWASRLSVRLEGLSPEGLVRKPQPKVEPLHLSPCERPTENIVLAEPFRLEIVGDFRTAAQIWGAIGAPFEQALCLMRCDDEDIKKAIEIFSRIGATVALRLAQEEAKSRGLRGLKRGPYRAASVNPMGLTARELQILKLICSGLTNARISQKLQRSERTVEHHVSAILAKTGNRSRASLAAWAHRNQILAPS